MYDLYNPETGVIVFQAPSRSEVFQYIKESFTPNFVTDYKLQVRAHYRSQKVGETEWTNHTDVSCDGEMLLKWVWPEQFCDPPNLNIKPKDFMCSCSPEGKFRCSSVIAEVKRQLSTKYREVTDANLLNSVVFALNDNLHYGEDDGEGSSHVYAEIKGIATDQWSAVSAEASQSVLNPETDMDDWKVIFNTYIQCDQVEAGIAATWLAMSQHFGEEGKQT